MKIMGLIPPLDPHKTKKKKKHWVVDTIALRSASILRKPITDLKKNQFIYFIIFLNLKFLVI
jgi:hypothetical protein